jgi:hypothetical protein
LGNQTAEVKAVLAALVQLDIQAVDGGAAIPAGPGIVFFDQLAPQVFQAVSQLGQHGCDRVLAVAATGCPLADGAPWELLRAGASDVLAWDQMANPVESIVARIGRWIEVDELLNSPVVRRTLSGHSRVWRSVCGSRGDRAYSDASVLITTAAPARNSSIHELDRRPGRAARGARLHDRHRNSPGRFFGRAGATGVSSRRGVCTADGGHLSG